MAFRKEAHTHVDRAVTRSSDVTSESKADANAGTTVASGSGNPAPRFVIEAKVARPDMGGAIRASAQTQLTDCSVRCRLHRQTP